MTCTHDDHAREMAVLADGYCPLCMAVEIDHLRRMLSSVAAQCGNVIFNCEQKPADNARHLNSWRGVKEFAEAALTTSQRAEK